MSKLNAATIGLAVSAIVFGAIVHAGVPGTAPDPRTYVPPVVKAHPAPPQRPARSRPVATMAAAAASVDEEAAKVPSVSAQAFSQAGREPTASGTPLTAPVSITYGGGSLALSVTDSGTNKGIGSYITNSKNSTSAVYGQTTGAGAGITGYNVGVTGPAGKFMVTNTASNQPAIAATTVGNGSAILGTQSSVHNPAGESGVTGLNNSEAGAGVTGYGENTLGVYGLSDTNIGIRAETVNGPSALFAISDVGQYAVEAVNDYFTAVYAYTDSGTGLLAYGANSGVGITVSTSSGIGIQVESADAPGIYAEAYGLYAIWGQSMDAVGVMGKDSGSGYGIYGSSVSGYAGYFDGKVAANAFVTLSDRNAKTNLQPVDGNDILERVAQLPISAWDFKSDSSSRHVGPMAQDFHAAFGLGGSDDTHINLADIAGVSLAAIQELSAKLQVKDAQIADLTAQLASQAQSVAQLKALAEQLAVRLNSIEHR